MKRSIKVLLLIASILTASLPGEVLARYHSGSASSRHHFNFHVKKRQLRIAVIDTGIDLKDTRFKGVLCESSSHHDFSGVGYMDDDRNHGTSVAGLIKDYAGDNNKGKYCLIILKYATGLEPVLFTDHYVKALEAAINEKADIVNISSTGTAPIEAEQFLMRTNPNIIFVVAAGNQGVDLDAPYNESYPASYRLPNDIAVGALAGNGGSRSYRSNYGSKTVTHWEIGEYVQSPMADKYCNLSIPYNYECSGPQSGTSFAAPIYTGKLIRRILESGKY